jgi:hypothetical protein
MHGHAHEPSGSAFMICESNAYVAKQISHSRSVQSRQARPIFAPGSLLVPQH